MSTIKDLRWENVGMGVALAGDWFTVNGKRRWISFMATSEDGRSRRRPGKPKEWSVIADCNPAYTSLTGEARRASVTKADCYRSDAAAEAFEKLAEALTAADKTESP